MEDHHRINNTIIIRILDFLDAKSLIECGANLLNKKIHAMLDCGQGVLTYSNNEEYYGRNDTESNYLEFPCQLKNKGDVLRKVTIEVITKDQGWASHPSSSFVDIAFLHKSTAEMNKSNFNYDFCHNLVRNRAVQNWVTFNFEYNDEKEENAEVFKAFLNQDNVAFIHTFCRYPGWQIHMKGATVNFYFERRNFSKYYQKELEKKKSGKEEPTKNEQ